MDKDRSKQKRRGGARADELDNITIGMTRKQLMEHIRRIDLKCKRPISADMPFGNNRKENFESETL